MAERRGMDEAQVDARSIMSARETLQKKIGAALEEPDDEAKEVVRARCGARWRRVTLRRRSSRRSSIAMPWARRRGRAKAIDEVKADWKAEREESLDTDLQGRWPAASPHAERRRRHRPKANNSGRSAIRWKTV
jgi:hypothetical protein